jgi:hypothetical protein
MSRKIDELMNSFVRGTATDEASLSKIFVQKAGSKSSSPRYSSVNVPVEVFDVYWDLYELSLRMAHSLDEVLNDSEHDLIMDEARKLSYRLPDIDLFRQEIRDYRAALDDFNPYTIKPRENGYVRVPIKTARMFHNLMQYNCFMISRVFDGCFNTDYMKHFTFLRQSGFAYAGPVALQETMNTLITMIRAQTIANQQVQAGRQHPDWGSLIAA